MNFKKSLASQRNGQATLEYFILFAIIAVLTILSFSTFFPRVQRAGERVFQSAVAKIIQ